MFRIARIVWPALVLTLLLGACGDGSTAGDPDAAPPRPDAYIGSCDQDPVPAFNGDHVTVMTSLAIAQPGEGFDLDYDGTPDNLLGPLGTLANAPIEDSFDTAGIVIPLEFFDVDDPANDDCVNISFYVSVYPPDFDEDGEKTGAFGDPENDCNDWDATIVGAGRAPELPGDGVDNDCNGLADETVDASMNIVPSTDTADTDGDGFALADGDCDDRDPASWPDAPPFWDPANINPGASELCGDGLDNDCDGIADNDCNPFDTSDGVDERLMVDEVGLTPDLSESLIVFRSARIRNGSILAGPSRFTFTAPIDSSISLELDLTAAILEADVSVNADGLSMSNGMLGGVLNGRSLDLVPNIAAEFFGAEDNTLLDVIVGPGGQLLALPTLGICRSRTDDADIPLPIIWCDVPDDCGDTSVFRCDTDVRAPDVDVDGDGIEVFVNVNLDGDNEIYRVDGCIDGDGETLVLDTVSATGMTTEHCTTATDGGGNPRFVDGYSIALRFTSGPAQIWGTYSSQ